MRGEGRGVFSVPRFDTWSYVLQGLLWDIGLRATLWFPLPCFQLRIVLTPHPLCADAPQVLAELVACLPVVELRAAVGPEAA